MYPLRIYKKSYIIVSMLTDTQITPVYAKARKDIRLSPGDTVRVYQKIVEKDKVRIQVFEGVIIAYKHGTEPGATFTVRRKSSDGIAVEKIFPLYSPMIDKIEVTKRTKTRRARLYFLREKTQKQIKDKLKRTKMVSEVTEMPPVAQEKEPSVESEPEAAVETDVATETSAAEPKMAAETGGAESNVADGAAKVDAAIETGDSEPDATAETGAVAEDAEKQN